MTNDEIKAQAIADVAEARALVSFYSRRGWDWRSALAFTLCRQLFGEDFIIAQKGYGRRWFNG